ncbi:MAG: hypothetical protein F4Y71_03695 [Acidobacteria bacterium]|nr:hypothetical protein [Acidobacteriota bacterium]MXW71223.1 hypothetical protein [Acidobacteriota bacterium]MXX85541.1 hypothetical protein [Acidobacteriota bacterium]MYE43157.1 hypothetical protein [Acidobacteriota bacterium]MYG75430.1 hypothetical protein [Acidobacteriota bacterium]
MDDSMSLIPKFPGEDPLFSVRTDSRGIVVVTGNDRIAFLTRIMSGELPAAPGAARTALLGPRGNLVATAIATVTSEAVLLECDRARDEALATALDRYRIADDVEIALAERGDFEIVGTDAAPTPGRPDTGPQGCVVETGAGYVRRDFRPWTAKTMVHVGLGTGGRESFRDLIEGGGESVEASPAEQEYLRVLAGEPRWGAELDERSLPLQSGLSAHVRLGRGCYIGQEYVARQAHRGRIPRLLRRLEFDEEFAPQVESVVLFQAGPAGRVTSAAPRPDGWDGPAGLALAVVSADVPAGASVQVLHGPTARLVEI